MPDPLAFLIYVFIELKNKKQLPALKRIPVGRAQVQNQMPRV